MEEFLRRSIVNRVPNSVGKYREIYRFLSVPSVLSTMLPRISAALKGLEYLDQSVRL